MPAPVPPSVTVALSAIILLAMVSLLPEFWLMLPLAAKLSALPPRKKLAVELLKVMAPIVIGLAMLFARGVPADPVFVAPVKTSVVEVAFEGAVPPQLLAVDQLTLPPLPLHVNVAADATEDAPTAAHAMANRADF